MKKVFVLLVWLASLAGAVPSFAASTYEGMAHLGQYGFQEPASPVMEKLVWLHDNLLLGIITFITIVVLLLMIYICVRFSRRLHPIPSKTTHNVKLETIWTIIPIIILLVIAVPSLRLHYYIQQHIEPEMTLKVTAYQWYWHYDYPDFGNFGFDSYMLKDKDLKPGDHRLLAVDNRLVVPVDTKIKVLVTGADVIHAFVIPAFGVKKDAVPGRLNETWFEATKVGTFYGQCSVLCGVNHAFMPIVVDVVSKDQFKAWVAGKQKEAGVALAGTAATDKAPSGAAVKSVVPANKPVHATKKTPVPAPQAADVADEPTKEE